MNIIFLISILIYLVHINIISIKSLHMLQQNRYNRGYRYIKWIIKNYKDNFINMNLLFLVFILIMLNDTLMEYSPYIFIIIYLFITYVFIEGRKKEKHKLPLKYTARIKRLMLTSNIIHILIILIMYLNFDYDMYNLGPFYLVLGFVSYINLFIIMITNFLNRPLEKMVGKHFENKAKTKLASMTNMEVIGVTGSYGKTSTKNILHDILSVKYNVFKTPANYNTPFGLMITINEHLDKYNDFFIAEMGACKSGEIKELCDLVHPKYGILTRVGLAHLETFGSEEAIQRTKFELIESLPSDGVGILNGDDEKQLSYKIKNDCKILWIGIDNKKVDCYAKNIELTYKGTKFTAVFKDGEEYEFETKLLGRNNIYNILAGITLGKELGISITNLQKAVKRVAPIEHRLSMTKYYDINIIDDAYNSNPMGSKMALEVLNMMPGKHIVVTPGMIEVGAKEDEVNKEFGRQIADNTDEVILIGEEKTKPIYEGLIEKKFPKEKIHVLNDVLDAFPLMMKLKDKETYVLLENDLPDSFNEKIRSDKK